MAKRSFSVSRLRKRVGRLLAPQVPHDSTRVSSFPFVSGDTFRLMAGTEFVDDGVRRFQRAPEQIAFVKADLVASEFFLNRYSQWAEKFRPSKPTLLVHNSDQCPTRFSLASLATMSSAVYCVNVVDEFENVFALPIGLENAALNVNGRLKLYLDGFDPAPSLRTRHVLASFHEQTNLAIRPAVRKLLEESRFGYDGFQWKLGEYRDELRRTKFVICPPGNGRDTHRTWESIYLGAVPVVLRDQLAASLISSNPILAVDDYGDFLELSNRQLDELYGTIRQKQPSTAYAAHWTKRFLDNL